MCLRVVDAYSLFAEVNVLRSSASSKHHGRVNFPARTLPDDVYEALVVADVEYSNNKVLVHEETKWEKKIASFTREGSPSLPRKKNPADKALAITSHLDIVSFVALFGALAVLVFPHLPIEARVDNLLVLLAKSNKSITEH